MNTAPRTAWLSGALTALLALCAFPALASAQQTTTAPTTTPSATAPPPTTAPPVASKPAPAKPKPRTRITGMPHGEVLGTNSLHVRFSAPLASRTHPTLSPRVAGHWRVAGGEEVFTPSSSLAPCSTYTLTVWGRIVTTGHRPLGKRTTLSLRVACPGTLALQQALARLRYLPYELRSRHRADARNGRESLAQAARYAYHPPRGPFASYLGHAPGLRYASLDATTRGALMVFQTGKGLPATGVADGRTWAALLADEARARADRRPYTFVTVSERIPETLRVYEGHHMVLSSPTNTGVPGAATQLGTFPIYARYVSTTMSGTNPDGSHYSDPGVPWVNYFNGGDAVHGFVRPSYGTPQSNGCVELPIGTAAQVYPLLSIGDLVIVSG